MALDGFGETTHTRKNYTIGQARIATLLGTGKENSLKLRDLRRITGLDNRTLRQRIRRERLEGEQIISDNQNGYFIAATEEEKNHFVRSMFHRAKEIQEVAEAVRRNEVL